MSRPQGSTTPSARGHRPRPQAMVAVAVFALIAALYLAWVPGVLLVNPDTAVYMGLGRSLARGEGYRFNFEAYAKYPPVFPLMLAAVYATVGESIWAMQAMGALCAVAALLAAFALVQARAGTWPALGVATLSAACTWYQSHAAVYIRADVAYAMFALTALWYAERRLRAPSWSWPRWGGVALLTLLALYTHLVGVALVGAVAAGAAFAAGQRRAVRQRLGAAAMVAVLGAAAVGFWLWRGRHIDNPMANYSKHTRVAPGEQTGERVTLAARMGLRLAEWVATPLNADVDSFLVGPSRAKGETAQSDDEPRSAVVGKRVAPEALLLIGLFIVPGLVAGLWRRRSAAEFYLVGHFAVMSVTGGPGGGPRYVLAAVPLLFYYAYASVRLLGAAAGWLLGPGAAVALPRVLVVVFGLGVLVQGVRVRLRCKRGASKFSAERRERDRRGWRAWQQAGQCVRAKVPADAVVYPGSGNTWAKLHYFSQRRMATLRYRDLGERCLRAMAAQGARFAFLDTHWRSRLRLGTVVRRHPECFPLVASYRDREEQWTLYEIDRQRLAEVVARRRALR